MNSMIKASVSIWLLTVLLPLNCYADDGKKRPKDVIPGEVFVDTRATIVAMSGAKVVATFTTGEGFKQQGEVRVFVFPMRPGPCYLANGLAKNNSVTLKISDKIIPGTYIIRLTVPYVDRNGVEYLMSATPVEITVPEQKVQ